MRAAAVLFCFLDGVAYLRAKTRAVKREEVRNAAEPGRKSRGTQVRALCTGRKMGLEVEAQMAEALPQIVKATVEQAKKGSLNHAKWLWDKAEESLRRKGEAQATRTRLSLAEMLMRELGD